MYAQLVLLNAVPHNSGKQLHLSVALFHNTHNLPWKRSSMLSIRLDSPPVGVAADIHRPGLGRLDNLPRTAGEGQ